MILVQVCDQTIHKTICFHLYKTQLPLNFESSQNEKVQIIQHIITVNPGLSSFLYFRTGRYGI